MSRGSSIGLSADGTLKAHLGLDTPAEILDQRLDIAVIEESMPARLQVDTRYVYIKARARRSLDHPRPIGTA